MSNDLIAEKIERIREKEGGNLLILGHHYQSDEMMRFVDFSGDSLELSRKAAKSKAAKIVFCGVKFMAETADILVRDAAGRECGRKVYLPAPQAGCPMADMATESDLEAAWQWLTSVDATSKYVPIVYVNSSAEVKAFCGRHGGSACTSGNGAKVVEHFLKLGYKILFAPDRYLCSNIMHDLGYADDEVAIYDYNQKNGNLTPEQVTKAKLIAWSGFCPRHAVYSKADVLNARKTFPDAEIMVHPESPEIVTRLADEHGSTKAIIERIQNAKPGRPYIIGTEQHLVARLIKDFPQLEIYPLKQIFCYNMGLATPELLLEVLENWPESHRVTVDDKLVPDARRCIEQMLAL